MESFLQWDPAQVLSYLKGHIGHDVSATFIDNNIDGLLLPYITSEHLRELGIEPLATRLRVKRAIYALISGTANGNSSSSGSIAPPSGSSKPGTPGITSNANTPGAASGSTSFSSTPTTCNFGHAALVNNQVSLEALSLCQILVQDIFKRTSQAMASAGPPALTTPGSAILNPGSYLGLASALASSDDIRKLNENFIKLKADLNPVIRYIKDSKPLPTPTLDPGVAAQLPTLLVNSKDHENGANTSNPGTVGPNHGESLTPDIIAPPHAPGEGITHSTSTNSVNSHLHDSVYGQNPTSPTQSRRLSSGSILSMGVGKITDLGKLSLSHRLFSKPRLVDSRLAAGSPADERPLPRDLDELKRNESVLKSRRSSSSVLSPTNHYFHGNGPTQSANHSKTLQLSLLNLLTSAQAHGTQPLKQLKASSDDTCLKVLQQAMKRHHIPRNHWSKYVLVICYGDKERILKLTEKPVIVFKELQEHGKNPAIMLRELAPAAPDGSDKYQDSRIGDDIPGGTL